MKCPVCGAEVSMEQFDLLSDTCRDCVDKRLGRKRKVYPLVVRWGGRIGHVLLCALVCAPFGVVGLGVVVVIGLWGLNPLRFPIVVFFDPLGGFLAWFGLGFPTGYDHEEHEFFSDVWKVFPAFLLAMAILVFCYYLDEWRGVLIGGALLGALIGAILSILSQLPPRTKAARRAP
jgi:hypothetical protein